MGSNADPSFIVWGQACSKPTGLLQISSDRDDQNISEGLKFSILGFLG